jgi:hypothetical protein
MPFFLLQPGSKPFVTLSQAYLPLPWNTGLFLDIRLRASHVILTSNAITYFRNDVLNDLHAAGWQAFNCTHSDDSLCLHSAELDFFNAKVVQEPYVYTDSLQRQYAVGRDICQRNSARQCGNSSRYTVSTCDLIDTHGQFVLLEQAERRMIFFKGDATSLLEYGMLAKVCLYAVATLANHAILLIKATKTADNAQPEADAKSRLSLFIPKRVTKYMQVSVLHVALSLYLAGAVLLDMPQIATQSETWLAWYLVVYILWDCIFCVGKICHNLREELKQINVMVVLLILCCLRLFHTFQNVFHLLLTVLFAIRTWCKVVLVVLINARATEPMKMLECNVSLMYDVVTLYAVLACMNHTTESAFHSQMLHITVMLIGVTAGALIAMLHKCK